MISNRITPISRQTNRPGRRSPDERLGPAPDDDQLERQVPEVEPLVDLGVERSELAWLAEHRRDRVHERSRRRRPGPSRPAPPASGQRRIVSGTIEPQRDDDDGGHRVRPCLSPASRAARGSGSLASHRQCQPSVVRRGTGRVRPRRVDPAMFGASADRPAGAILRRANGPAQHREGQPGSTRVTVTSQWPFRGR